MKYLYVWIRIKCISFLVRSSNIYISNLNGPLCDRIVNKRECDWIVNKRECDWIVNKGECDRIVNQRECDWIVNKRDCDIIVNKRECDWIVNKRECYRIVKKGNVTEFIEMVGTAIASLSLQEYASNDISLFHSIQYYDYHSMVPGIVSYIWHEPTMATVVW